MFDRIRSRRPVLSHTHADLRSPQRAAGSAATAAVGLTASSRAARPLAQFPKHSDPILPIGSAAPRHLAGPVHDAGRAPSVPTT